MCTACPPIPRATDTDRISAFEQRLVGAFNDGALMLMTSVGHRTGLFDTMAGMTPATSQAIASRAGLDERYVREWLGAMVCARVIEHDGVSGTYVLPAEHAARLTRAADANMAVVAQFFAVLGGVEDDIVACFRNGGGVPYQRFGRFHEVMAEESGQTVLPALTTAILPLVSGLIGRLERGIQVLDLGCGRGRAILQLAEAFPNSSFRGMDLSGDAIAWARTQAEARGLENATFEVRDLSDFDRTAPQGRFDLVTTFDAVHDQAKPANMLKGIRRALGPDGVYIAQDIKGSSEHSKNLDAPLGSFFYTISCMHCMTVSLAQGGDGLGAMWGRELAEQMFREAGFGTVEVHELEHDIQNYYYVCKA
ncbi:MAG: class I SAM-dependent methyltransferase [Bauldia sp.]|nr:class I SAM-dependent methyltransferase [Bauldia sp.]MCB1504025.1 class I SAM-dependent methyltransferase [Hyphomicrobiaceae bacterium]